MWTEWTTSTGGTFGSFNEAITANQPYGLGVGQYHGWISAAQAWALCAGHGNVRKELLKLAADEVEPIAEHGDIGNGRSRDYNVMSTSQGNSAEYLLGRIKREALNGNAKAVEAMEGITMMYWKRANATERKELLAWLKTAEAKQRKRTQST